MPRIDPHKLLNCLAVLLTPEGGILSKIEVPRLVSLMTKFSKKLVSKCVYILILTNTETGLLELFMSEGGWTLIQTWLEDAIKNSNDDLIVEILKLLLITPADTERLKSNALPRLVKTLSRRDENSNVKEIATLVVQKWLAIVRNTTQEISQNKNETSGSAENVIVATIVEDGQNKPDDDIEIISESNKENDDAIDPGSFYKVTVRDGKQVISRLVSSENEEGEKEKPSEEKKSESEKRDKSDKDKSRSKSSSSKSSSSKSSSSSSSKDKYKSSSSSKSSSRDKDKDRSKDKDNKSRDRDKDKHRSNGSLKSSSSSSSKGKKDSNRSSNSSSSSSITSTKDKDSKSKHSDKDSKNKPERRESKEKQAEKDKDTLAKLKPISLDKLGRIPKKPSEDKKEPEEKKKGTISIEVRKNEDRPKTVKVFNSKMRSTGLEEEVKPPPPRSATKKATPTSSFPALPLKRSSPPHDVPIPEKKVKLDALEKPVPERPGAIKLIPPKPKPVLLESLGFMDALTASATAKKEPKKRKRRLSVSKDSPGSPPQSPSKDQSSPTATSPPSIKNIAPPNFYQDTLQTNEDEPEKETENDSDKEEKKAEEEPVASPKPETEEMESSPQEPKKMKSDSDGLKGVLVYIKKKGPKKTLRWKSEEDLVEVRHFELDETERVNVSKTFGDMAKNDIISEREALQMVRKLPAEDLMEAQITWRVPRPIDLPKPPAQPGSKSLEKDIQFAREKNVLQALYFHKRLIPDTPAEPIPENYQIVDPLVIPLDDSETQEIDLRNTPWPEPKTAPPVEAPVNNIPPMFRNVPQPPFQNFPPMNAGNFQGIPPRFGAPNHPMAAPQMHEGGPMIDNPQFMNPGGFAPHNMINPALIAPNLMPPGDMMNQGPMEPMFNDFNANMTQGPGPSDGFGMPMMDPNFTPMQNFPPNVNNYNNNNFNMNRGGGNRGFRRGGNSGGGRWVTLNNGGPGQGSNQGPGRWNRGGHNRTNRVCKNVKNHGYCRNIETCPFIHPN